MIVLCKIHDCTTMPQRWRATSDFRWLLFSFVSRQSRLSKWYTYLVDVQHWAPPWQCYFETCWILLQCSLSLKLWLLFTLLLIYSFAKIVYLYFWGLRSFLRRYVLFISYICKLTKDMNCGNWLVSLIVIMFWGFCNLAKWGTWMYVDSMPSYIVVLCTFRFHL
jgi:hypothetical protein